MARREKGTKTHNIFLLDKTRLEEQLSVSSNTPVSTLLEQLMSSDEGYAVQNLKEGVNTASFSIKLYFRKEDNFQSKFASFCKSFVADGQDVLTYYPRSSSSVLFIWNDKNLYAIPTGQGFRMIENNTAVIHAMYTALEAGKRLPYDLFHKNTIDFVSADNYVIYDPTNYAVYYEQDDYDPTQLISVAYQNYLNGNPSTEAAFFTFISSSKLRADRGEYMQTDGTILQHISGEVEVNNINYYVFYGDYYRLSTSYDDRLKDSLRGKLLQIQETSEIQTIWDYKKDEDWFNKTVSENEGFAHLHKIKPDYIEFCDLLKCDDETITFVHVKDGFDGDMRVLDRQVDLSIRKIMDYKQNNQADYMKRLYKNASVGSTGTNITSLFPSEQDFLEALKSKQIRYIIAIRPQNPDLVECRSNIAKHCLNALILRCFNQGVDLKIQKL